MRILLAHLLAWSLLLGGCWDWSFPPELLKEDSRPPEASVDITVDAPPDVEPPDGPGIEAAPDLVGLDTLPCGSACSGTTPVCDNGTCRGCQGHGECQGISNGELCAADGSCPAEGSVAYVDVGHAQCSSGDGTKNKPYCQIDEAVGQGKTYVRVRPGTYTNPLTFDKVTREIYGEPGVVIDLSDCEKILVKTTSKVHLQGLEIRSDPTKADLSKAMILMSETATLTVSQSKLGPSGCIAIKSSTGNTVTLRRNLVVKNPGGGLLLLGTYTVENNIIVQNSSTSVNFGGAKLDPASVATSAFVNNTVADNTCKGSNDSEACGVRCEADKTPLVNNIFWGNTFNSTGTAGLDRQYSTKCTATFSFEELKSGAPTGTGNITAGVAGFVGSPPGPNATDYHIKPSCAAKNSGKSGGPAVDYDGQLRDATPDIGADELDVPLP
jgi:hypothetical protein